MKESKLEKIARIIAKQYNIKVIFGGDMAYTDGKIINLPYMDEIKNENIKNNIDGYLDHEVAHCLFTDFEEVIKIDNKYHHTLLNFTEDIRIEREMMKKYTGTKFHILPLREWIEEKTLKGFDKIPWPMKFCFELQLFMKNELKAPHKETKKYFDLCRVEISQLNDATSTKELREITEEIFKKLLNEVEKEELEKGNQPQQPQNGDSSESQQGQNGENQEQSESEGNETGDNGDGASENKSQSQESQGTSSQMSKGERELARQILKGDEELIKKHSNDVHDYFNDEFKKEFKKNPNRYSVETTEFDEEIKSKITSMHKTKYKNLKRTMSSISKKMANKLERVLKAKSMSRWSGDKERGSVNPKKLSSVLTDKNNKRVFRNFEKEESNKISVSLLVDLSGSMSGNKIENAKLTATALSETLRLLNIEHEILGFTTIYNYKNTDPNKIKDTRAVPLKHTVFKSFYDDDSSGITSMKAENTNADSESVLWAAKRLAETKKERKILFVLSDGLPNVMGEKRNEITLREHLKESVTKIEKSGIEVVAFGIQSTSVKEFYKKNVIVNDVKELPNSVVNELIKILK